MIEWFKDGKALPKRYVWEIVLGAHDHFASTDSLVDVELQGGVTCDVIGDVHGERDKFMDWMCPDVETIRPILRHVAPFFADWRAE